MIRIHAWPRLVKNLVSNAKPAKQKLVLDPDPQEKVAFRPIEVIEAKVRCLMRKTREVQAEVLAEVQIDYLLFHAKEVLNVVQGIFISFIKTARIYSESRNFAVYVIFLVEQIEITPYNSFYPLKSLGENGAV